MISYSEFLTQVLQESGKLVLHSFGTVLKTTQKEDPSQVVTDIDLVSEKLLIDAIERSYPDHSIIAEESGFVDKESEYTWIIDPIDGTSNFARGIPWFGVMIALLKKHTPIASGIYLPVTDELYTAEKEKGLFRNGKKIVLPTDMPMKESLISFCTDSSENESHNRFLTGIFTRLLPRVRNLRATNSAVDDVYAAEGKLGGLLVFKSKIWDVAPVALLAKEAGQVVTDDFGKELTYPIDNDTFHRNYAFIIARPSIHESLVAIVREARNSS